MLKKTGGRCRCIWFAKPDDILNILSSVSVFPPLSATVREKGNKGRAKKIKKTFRKLARLRPGGLRGAGIDIGGGQ